MCSGRAQETLHVPFVVKFPENMINAFVFEKFLIYTCFMGVTSDKNRTDKYIHIKNLIFKL